MGDPRPAPPLLHPLCCDTACSQAGWAVYGEPPAFNWARLLWCAPLARPLPLLAGQLRPLSALITPQKPL